MNDLVERLSKPQPVEVGLRPERRLDHFKAAVDRGYVHIVFKKTGTELGVRVTTGESDLSRAEWTSGRGKIKLTGTLVLNYNRVKCHAEIDLATLDGKGRLEFLEEVTASQLAREREARESKAT
jgi:hypothetical protein